jgi:hypothetical protein
MKRPLNPYGEFRGKVRMLFNAELATYVSRHRLSD